MSWPPRTWREWLWLALLAVLVSFAFGVGRAAGVEFARSWWS